MSEDSTSFIDMDEVVTNAEYVHQILYSKDILPIQLRFKKQINKVYYEKMKKNKYAC